jgi:DNA polymerase-3 subunit delta
MARAGVYLFHGGEAYLVERAFAQTWKELTAGLDSELDWEILDPDAGPEDLRAAAGSPGFFAPQKVVGIRDWQALRAAPKRKAKIESKTDVAERAAAVLSELPDGSAVVLSATASLAPTHPVLKLAREKGHVEEFPKLRFGAISAWVQRRAHEIKLSIDNAGLQQLVDSVGDDLRLLDAELSKLKLFADDQTVTAGQVATLVPDSAEHQIWDLTDALLVDPGRAAVELDRALDAGEPPGRLSFMLVRHLRLVLAAAAAGQGAAGIARLSAALGGEGRPVSEYSIKKAQNQARSVEPDRLEALYARAAAVEAASRRGELEDDAALRVLVLSVAGR